MYLGLAALLGSTTIAVHPVDLLIGVLLVGVGTLIKNPSKKPVVIGTVTDYSKKHRTD